MRANHINLYDHLIGIPELNRDKLDKLAVLIGAVILRTGDTIYNTITTNVGDRVVAVLYWKLSP